MTCINNRSLVRETNLPTVGLHYLFLCAVLIICFLPVACGDSIHIADINNIRCEGSECRIFGTLTNDTFLAADKNWHLKGSVFVGNTDNPTTLTIEAGAVIKGDATTNSVLVISIGSRIIAEGTSDAPIVFTSSNPPGQRAPGDWGGLVINGRARQSLCTVTKNPCIAMGAGLTMEYGGDDDNDSSGSLKYVRIEFAGRYISTANEIDGLTLHAVGSGTVLDYIQIHKSEDDGLAFFGGTVNVKHVLITGALDDGIDWTDGWRGKAQFVIAQQNEGRSDNGLEADNSIAFPRNEPLSHPCLSNITLVGVPDSSNESDIGLLLRGGTAVNLYSSIVTGFNEACLDVDDTDTFELAILKPENFTVKSTVLYCATLAIEDDQMDDESQAAEDLWSVVDYFRQGEGNTEVAPLLKDPFSVRAPDFRPADASPVRSGAIMPKDDFFELTEFIGAMGDDDWTAGWSAYPQN